LPEHVRQAAIAYTRRRVAQGASQAMIARELGVTTISVSRWVAMGRASAAPSTSEQVRKMRRVRVVDAKRATASAGEGPLHLKNVLLYNQDSEVILLRR
jgi:predicted transcriptional regulator